jgi:hypothetical protein
MQIGADWINSLSWPEHAVHDLVRNNAIKLLKLDK